MNAWVDARPQPILSRRAFGLDGRAAAQVERLCGMVEEEEREAVKILA